MQSKISLKNEHYTNKITARVQMFSSLASISCQKLHKLAYIVLWLKRNNILSNAKTNYYKLFILTKYFLSNTTQIILHFLDLTLYCD